MAPGTWNQCLEEALRLVQERGCLPFLPSLRSPSLTELVLGSPATMQEIMKHPQGGWVGRIAERLSQMPDVVVMRSEVAFLLYVHRKLVPAIWRVLGNEAFKRNHFPPEALKLLERLRTEREIDISAMTRPLDREQAWRVEEAVRQLSRWRLVDDQREPRANGQVQVTIGAGTSWVTPEDIAKASELSYEDALRSLEEVLGLMSNDRDGST